MIIKNIKITEKNKKARLSADIYVRGKSHIVYVEVDSRFKHFICNDASAFLAAALIPAMKLRDPILVEGSVSTELSRGIKKIMKIFNSWDIGFHPVSITLEKTKRDSISPKGSGLFFSAGVDSFYTLLENNRKKNKISHLIFVHGMDIPLSETKLHNEVLRNMEMISKATKTELVHVQTNIREFVSQYATWDFTHGSLMASVALALRNEFKAIYVSGGMQLNHLRPYGLHPHIDPLWSTEKMLYVHFGAEIDRLEKIQRQIATSEVALKYLRVCWRNKKGGYNCSVCEKCIRTMLSLYNCGVLKKSKMFKNHINPALVKQINTIPNHIRYFKENLVELRKTGKNPELESALEICIQKNSNHNKLLDYYYSIRKEIGKLDEKYLNGRLFYNLSKQGLV